MRPTPPRVKEHIVALLRSGMSARAVAAQVGVSRTTVARVRSAECPDLAMPRPGRPRILSVHDERHIVRQLATGEHNNAVQAQQAIGAATGVHVSTQTVRRVVRRSGLRAHVRPRKPLLSKKHRQRRLAFARKYAEWTVDDWKRVVWSDETSIEVHGTGGRSYSYRHPGQPLQAHDVRPTVKHGGGAIMAWGCITAKGIGHLCRIDGGLDATLYQSILEEDFLGTLDWYRLNRDEITFQHDNAPPHTAHPTTRWLAEHEIQVLDWPPQSPDLNPIENLWQHLKQRLAAHPNPATSVAEHWERVEKEWDAIEPAFCAKLIASMPQRVDAVLKAKGGYIKW